MSRGNDFQEIIGAIFTIIVFIIIVGALISTLGSSMAGLAGVIIFIFFIGVLVIIIGLIISIFKMLSKLFG